MTTVALVPRRADNGRRDQVWAWVRERWEAEHPDIAIFEGHDNDSPRFNRSLAINRAAEKAAEWDAAVIFDSDSFVGPDQINQAVEGCHGNVEFWLAYDVFSYLNRNMSDRIMRGYVGAWEPGVEWSMTGTCSSMVVVSRRLWDEVHGFDPRFEGWGFEDVAASHAFQTFGNGLSRAPGTVWHLHHSPSAENSHEAPEWHANRDRMMAYADAAYDKPAMRALIDAR